MFLMYSETSLFRRSESRYRWKVLIVSHHLAKIFALRICSGKDIVDVIFYVTLQEYVIKWSCDCMEGSSSMHIPTFPCLVSIGIMVVDI